MVNWIPLDRAEQLQHIAQRSNQIPCIIFKHSTSCSISSLARHRLENYWDLEEDQAEFYLLDLLRHRDISNGIAEHYGVRHESPQILIIRDGHCISHSSHLDITAGGIKAHLGVRMDR